jgi:hypothetical protein
MAGFEAVEFVADYQKSVTEYPKIKSGEEFEGYAPS